MSDTPGASIPEIDHVMLSAVCGEALAAIERWLRELTIASKPELMHKHAAAGFIARGAGFLRSMEILAGGGRDDVGGYLYRGVLECYFLGLYVLLGGEEALNHVLGDHRRNVENYVRANDDAELKEATAEWAVEPRHLNLEDIATRLGPLLTAAGEETEGLKGLYNSAFRNASTFETHGFGALLRYVDLQDGLWRVNPNPDARGVETRHWIGLGTFLVAHLTSYTRDQLGYDVGEVGELLLRLVDVFNPAELSDIDPGVP